MFKNLLTFRVVGTWSEEIGAAEAALEEDRFASCAISQEKSQGWIEPRGEANGPLIESISGHWILRFKTESKILPGSVVRDELDKRCEIIEEQTGRKVGKKEKRELKEDVRLELLTKAFTKTSTTNVWIDKENSMLVIDAPSSTKADAVLTFLVKGFKDFSCSLIQPKNSVSGSMAAWLNSKEAPPGFSADRDCVLKAVDESKSSVRYAKHRLDIDEVQGHIAAGKVPTQLAMTWKDRVSFTLTDAGGIKKVEFLDVAIDSGRAESADAFDADVAIATGELSEMIPDVIEALGGEMQL